MLSGARHLRPGEMRPPGVLPLLDQNEGAVRPEVLRRVPGAARQGNTDYRADYSTAGMRWEHRRPWYLLSYVSNHLSRTLIQLLQLGRRGFYLLT